MIDISSLDLDELAKLEAAIKNRKKELKKLLSKDELQSYSPILNYIFENFPGVDNDLIWSEKYPIKVSDLGEDVHEKIIKGMMLLCDMALKNYQLSHRRKGRDQCQIARQSAIIPARMSEDYRAMWTDIWNVYMKYAK